MVEADPPRWADGIGERPNDPALLTQWRGHVGVVATYRELHDITHDDPAYPLGPYIEPNQPGHHEFWHAAAAVLATHNLTEEDSTPAQATPTGEAHGLSSVSGPPLDSDRFDEVALRAAVAHRIAADTYRALPDSERTAVTAGLITRLGNLRFDNDPATTVTQRSTHANYRPHWPNAAISPPTPAICRHRPCPATHSYGASIFPERNAIRNRPAPSPKTVVHRALLQQNIHPDDRLSCNLLPTNVKMDLAQGGELIIDRNH